MTPKNVLNFFGKVKIVKAPTAGIQTHDIQISRSCFNPLCYADNNNFGVENIYKIILDFTVFISIGSTSQYGGIP